MSCEHDSSFPVLNSEFAFDQQTHLVLHVPEAQVAAPERAPTSNTKPEEGVTKPEVPDRAEAHAPSVRSLLREPGMLVQRCEGETLRVADRRLRVGSTAGRE